MCSTFSIAVTKQTLVVLILFEMELFYCRGLYVLLFQTTWSVAQSFYDYDLLLAGAGLWEQATFQKKVSDKYFTYHAPLLMLCHGCSLLRLATKTTW